MWLDRHSCNYFMQQYVTLHRRRWTHRTSATPVASRKMRKSLPSPPLVSERGAQVDPRSFFTPSLVCCATLFIAHAGLLHALFPKLSNSSRQRLPAESPMAARKALIT
jgi:hypothetical protein